MTRQLCRLLHTNHPAIYGFPVGLGHVPGGGHRLFYCGDGLRVAPRFLVRFSRGRFRNGGMGRNSLLLIVSRYRLVFGTES